MLGEISKGERRARRVPKGSVLITPGRKRGAVPGLQHRLHATDDVPAAGRIVFRRGRTASLILR